VKIIAIHAFEQDWNVNAGEESTMRAPFRPSLRFLYHYVLEQGFRDGYRLVLFVATGMSG